MGKEEANEALVRTAIQLALGYSYEQEKAFQTGIKITVTEHVPPSEKMLVFLLQRRLPYEYGDKRINEQTLSLNKGLLAALEELRERSKQRRAERAKLIEQESSEVA